MNGNKISTLTTNILRFYTKCFLYPYDEMTYELQHLYRIIEREEISAEEVIHVDQILNIINQYQGVDIKNLRDEYVVLFSSTIDREALCPLIASDFLANYARHYNQDKLLDLLWDSGIQTNLDEPVDSIINLLEYTSILCEDFLQDNTNASDLNSFFENHILLWIPQLCDVLNSAAQLAFYREVASGLKSYILWLR